jgi:hypothetical protein
LCSSARIRRSAVRGARKGLTERREGMRGEKEIREALKRLKDEHLRRMRQPDSYSPPAMLIAMVGTLEWVLGDRERLPDFK